MSSTDLSRRSFLRSGGALLPALGVLATLPASACSGAREGDGASGWLSESQRRILGAVAETVVGMEPGRDGAVSVEQAGVVDFLDRLLPTLPEEVQEKFPLLLLGVERGAHLFSLSWRGFSSMDATDRAAALEGWATSRIELRRVGFRALKNLTLLGYYASDEAWPSIRYDGPWVEQGITLDSIGPADPPAEGAAARRAARALGPDPAEPPRGGDTTLRADVVIVGSGAGGAPIAHELARAGLDVVVLEAGPRVDEPDMLQRVPEMVSRLYWDGGARVTESGGFTVSQGRCVGGSTVHYTAWAMRPPPPVLARWHYELGVADLEPGALDAHVEHVERMLSTRRIAPAEINPHNHLVKRGADRLGLRGGICRHNRVGCIGCGYCLLGCAYDRKQTMANTFLPAARVAGARVVSGAHVEKILTRGALATAVRARLVDADGATTGALTVEAERFVLAAGTIHSPVILRRSGIGDSSGQLGRNLVFHTTTTLFGLFEEDVNAHRGFTPAYVIDQFIDLDYAPERGFYLVPAFAPPAAIAPFLPGFGADHARWMQRYTRLAGLSVMLHDSSRGSVSATTEGLPIIDYALGEADRKELVEGMIAAGRVLFAAGAKEVMPASTEGIRFTSPGQLKQLWELGDLTNKVALNTPHPQGTCRMGSDRRTSVVNPWGQTHDIGNLFVSDMSTFPTSIGAPPSTTTAALALRTAAYLLETS